MKRIIFITIIFCSGLIRYAWAQSSDRNYIKTTTYLNETGTSSLKTIQYYDGLGRHVQTVQQNAGPSNNNQDLISIQDYDPLGREFRTWLPIYRSANNGAYYSGVLANDSKSQYGNDAYAYSEPIYEPSPLNRIIQQYGPGQAWRTAGRQVKTDYLANNSSYPCRYYFVLGENLVKDANDYPANTLYVVKTTDEDNKVSYVFTDKLGRVVLQRQIDGTEKFDTYYVFDDLGKLRFVLPPMASESLAATSTTTYNPTSNLILNDFAYIYKYNERLLCKEKKLPGADPILYVYDKADRLIFSQDGEQRPTKSWTFYKYDVFGRVILTGVWKNSGKTQDNLDSQYKNELFTENYSTTGAYNYTWNYFGIPSSMVLQANYYDNYQIKTKSLDFGNINQSYSSPSGFDNKRYGTDVDLVKSKGLLTASLSLMLDNPSTKLRTLYYYDEMGRMIQSVVSNLLGGFEKEYINYSFTGNPTRRQTVHSASGKASITEIYTYSYDHANRPTTTQYKIDNDPEFILSTLAYDNQGRVANKKQSETAMTVSYSYNIRNWLTQISSTAFNENIYYNESYAGNTPQYNGNISAVSWRHLTNSNIQGFSYTYDGLNRLKKGQYLSGTTASNDFTEEVSLYDKNGNIMKLKRYARNSPPTITNNGILVDDLTLSFRGNQLTDITDAIPATTSTIGFVKPSVSISTNPIVYNSNGAMKFNFYNGIAGITYNVLNLPEKIRFMYGHGIQYSYDASGTKYKVVHQTVKSNLNIPLGTAAYTPNVADIQTTLTTDYCASGHIVYENGALKYILNPEGYATKQSNGTYSYYYYSKDHLGNNQTVFSAKSTSSGGLPTTFGASMQEISYYPFGMPFTAAYQPRDGYNPEMQPYKFGDKEYDEMHGLNWYDFNARYYWGIIPVLTTPDPMAEKYYSVSPYAYCANNPVNFVDLRGDSVTISGTEIQSAFQQVKASVANELNLTLQNNGTMQATQTSTTPLSNDAQQLFDAANSGTITVNINTVSGSADANGNLIVGGAFEGNVVTQTANGNTVIANQTINPKVLEKMSNAHSTPGKDVLHEITESYQGGLISQKTGVSSPASNQQGSVYNQAHNNATPQSGTVTQTIYGTFGMPISAFPNGTYPSMFPITKVEWSVINTSGQRVVIQTLR